MSVVIPAYNEEKCLEKNILKYYRYLKGQNFNFEIIIVNDGSTDQTAELAKALAGRVNRIRLIDQQANQGKGAAVQKGMLEARGRYCLFLDADNSTDISHLSLVWPWLEKNCEIVIGSRNPRDVKGSGFISSQPAWKRALGKSGNLLIQRLTGLKIWDTQCGFKLFSREAAQAIFPRLLLKRWLFDIEALILARKENFAIGIVPVQWENNRDSKVGLAGYFNSLLELYKIKRNLKKKKYEANSNDTGPQ